MASGPDPENFTICTQHNVPCWKLIPIDNEFLLVACRFCKHWIMDSPFLMEQELDDQDHKVILEHPYLCFECSRYFALCETCHYHHILMSPSDIFADLKHRYNFKYAEPVSIQ